MTWGYSAGSVTANSCKVLLTDHFYHLIKHFYPDKSGLFPDDPAPIHRVQDINEWFNKHKKILCLTLCYGLHSYQISARLWSSGRFWSGVLDFILFNTIIGISIGFHPCSTVLQTYRHSDLSLAVDWHIAITFTLLTPINLLLICIFKHGQIVLWSNKSFCIACLGICI